MQEKMTPMELGFAWWIRRRGGVFRLRDIGRTIYFPEYRKLVRFLRLRGYVVDIVENRKRPGSNLYTVRPPDGVWSLQDKSRGPGRPTVEEVRLRSEPTFDFMRST